MSNLETNDLCVVMVECNLGVGSPLCLYLLSLIYLIDGLPHSTNPEV